MACALVVSLAPVLPTVAHASGVRTSFVSDSSWSVYRGGPPGLGALVGPAQAVCLNGLFPTSCPAGATLYGYPGFGWGADLASIPGAAWIWGPGVTGSSGSADLAELWFAKTVTLGGAALSGTLAISADDSAQVWVNGSAIGSVGSVDDPRLSSLSQGALTTFDIGPYLVSGPNTLAIRGQNGPQRYAGCASPCSYAQNPAAVVFGGSLTSDAPASANGSLMLNGTTAYAQAPHDANLNVTSDWTVEAWFADDDSKGFEHDYVTLLNKGDRASSGEAPYVITLGYKRLLVGLRHAWTDYTLQYDLFQGRVDARLWHHVAATLQRSARTLTVYLDGVQVAQGVLGAETLGNTLPVQIGRSGPQSGKYFHGRLDDVRIWNVARSAADIASSYRSELSGSQAGLLANWKFNEGVGSTALDSAGHHDAVLNQGAVFSSDTHP